MRPIRRASSRSPPSRRLRDQSRARSSAPPRTCRPEQAKGSAADKRSDIWAFGVVLYEMLTGQRPFDGEGTTEILAAVLRQRIDWTTLPKATPAVVKALLIRCLERDTKRRLRDIGEARIALEDAGNRPEAGIDTLPAGDVRRSRRRQAVVTIGTALAAGVLVGITVWVAGRPAPQRLTIRNISLHWRKHPSISRQTKSSFAITPDGSPIVWGGS